MIETLALFLPQEDLQVSSYANDNSRFCPDLFLQGGQVCLFLLLPLDISLCLINSAHFSSKPRSKTAPSEVEILESRLPKAIIDLNRKKVTPGLQLNEHKTARNELHKADMEELKIQTLPSFESTIIRDMMHEVVFSFLLSFPLIVIDHETSQKLRCVVGVEMREAIISHTKSKLFKLAVCLARIVHS